MLNILISSYMRKASYDNENIEAITLSDFVRHGKYACDDDNVLTEEERRAMAEGVVFLSKVISGENPINGGSFSSDSYYVQPLTFKYLRDVYEMFTEPGELKYTRYAEARTFLRGIGSYIHHSKPIHPDDNDFYGEKAELVFYELAELLRKYCKPLIKH
jgi:hypothetical protein